MREHLVVVLNDGETFSSIHGCSVEVVLPSDLDADRLPGAQGVAYWLDNPTSLRALADLLEKKPN